MNKAFIKVKIDCGNTPIQKDEELWFKNEIIKLIKRRGMSVQEIQIQTTP